MILPIHFNLRQKVRSLDSLNDEQLMSRVSAKDDDRAYNELYRRHARRLMGFFSRQLNHDEALAADLTQDAFMRVWANRQKYAVNSVASSSGTPSPLDEGGRRGFSTWLFSIAYNLCKNHYRHLSYEQAYEQDVKHTESEEHDEHFDVQMDKDAFDKALRAELEQLPPPSRLLFSLRFEEDLSVLQIASVIGIPEGTVKSRLHTLVQNLKQKLQHYGKF